MGNSELGGPASDSRRFPARENGRLFPRLVPQGKANPSRTWKCLVSTPLSSSTISAVGQDAVDVGDQQLDRLAPLGQLGRHLKHPWPVTPRGRREPARSSRSRRSGRPADGPRSTTGSSLILWAFIISTASASVAPTRIVYGSARHDRRRSGGPDRPSRRFSNSRARSLSVKIPSNRRASSAIKTAPSGGAGRPAARTRSRTVSSTCARRSLAAGAHHVLDPRQLATQAARRVIEGEIVGA